ncbi:NmrA family NAD(P)-binding protein [Pseudonocardia sp. DLS-67]
MIVITTPTGRIGREVVENVLESGTAVRVIVRDPARLPPHVRDRVEVVPGSHSDVDVLMKAFAGADGLFWLIPPNPRAESVQEHVLDFVRPLCAAVNRQGIARVVAVSTLGRGITRNAGQVSATYAMDDLIESTGVSYRSLCPPSFMENLLGQAGTIARQGVFFSPMPGDRRFLTCAVRDIAAAAARVLLDRSWTGQESVPVVGPDELSHDEMARIMTDVLQRPVRFQQVSGEAFKETLLRHGMSEAWAQGMVDIQTATAGGAYNPVGSITPTAPTSFREWCERTLVPAVS